MSLSRQYSSQLGVYLIIHVKSYPKKLLGYRKSQRTNQLDKSNSSVVPKSNDAVRICLDMRCANGSLIRERHQTPKLEETLPELNNVKYFSKIDLRERYQQIELDPNSNHVTTFIMQEATFQSKRLVYGVKTTFEKFQQIIEQTITECPGTKSISIDILF